MLKLIILSYIKLKFAKLGYIEWNLVEVSYLG
jgi:hypothetical protein